MNLIVLPLAYCCVDGRYCYSAGSVLKDLCRSDSLTMSQSISEQDQMWDPMKQDFFNPTFNSYAQGPGVRLDLTLQSCVPKVNKDRPVYKLHVRNIPEGLTERGIKNIFLRYGSPFDVFKHSAGWAFVSYATQREAELAIRHLNTTPFKFRVQFARSAEEKERIRQERAKDEALAAVIERESYPIQGRRPNIYSGRGAIHPLSYQLKAANNRPGKKEVKYDCTGDDDFGYFTPYVPGVYHVGNRLIMQGVKSSLNTSAGTRKIVTGHSYYSTNEVWERAEEKVKVYETVSGMSERYKQFSDEDPETNWTPYKSDCMSSSKSTAGETKSVNAVEGLKSGMNGICQVLEKLHNDEFTATIVYEAIKKDVITLSNFLRSAMLNDVESDSYVPSNGELVLAFTSTSNYIDEQQWLKARVLTVGEGKYSVAICDYGRLATVTRVRKSSLDLSSFPDLAIRCTISGNERIKETLRGSKFRFNVTGIEHDRALVTCYSLDKKETWEAVFTPWSPTCEKERLFTVPLKNNDIVMLSAFYDQKSLYVRPISNGYDEKFLKIPQDLALHCLNTPEINRIPYISEIVACRFQENENYYRAQVIDIQKEDIIVAYVDFGHQETVTVDKLKPITSDLKKIPAMAVKVSLNNIVDRPLTKKAVDLLTHLITEEMEMKIICCTGNSSNDGVVIILSDGRNLNQELNSCLNYDSVKNSEENKLTECKIFHECDIKYLELPLNKNVELLILSKRDEVTFVCCEAFTEMMTYVHDVMSSLMNEYCQSASEETYVPRQGELCFAKYADGLWYRAVYIADSADRENNILLLDFGIMSFIDKANIRKMTEEYIMPPVIGVQCTLKDLPSQKLTPEQKKCIGELISVKKIYNAQVVSSDIRGEYVVEFPHITEELKKKGLLID